MKGASDEEEREKTKTELPKMPRHIMSESRTTRSGFFKVLDTWDERRVAPGKPPFCLSTSMENGPCLLVKL